MNIDKLITDRGHESHSMRDTSLLTYGWLQNVGLGEKQRKVFEVIKTCTLQHNHPTDREIARKLDYKDPNKVRPRRFELMEEGIIVEAGKRKCSISGRLALTWKVPEHLLNNGDGELFKRVGDYYIQTRFVSPPQWENLVKFMATMQYVYVGNMKWSKKG